MIKDALENIDLNQSATQRKIQRDIIKILAPETHLGEVFNEHFDLYTEKFKRAKTEDTLLERMTFGALRKIEKEDDYDPTHARGCTIQAMLTCINYSHNHKNIEKIAILLATHARLNELNNEKTHNKNVQEVVNLTGATGSKKRVSDIDQMTRSLEETIESMQSRKGDFQAARPQIDLKNISKVIQPPAKKDFRDIEDQLSQALKNM